MKYEIMEPFSSSVKSRREIALQSFSIFSDIVNCTSSTIRRVYLKEIDCCTNFSSLRVKETDKLIDLILEVLTIKNYMSLLALLVSLMKK